MNSLIIFSMAIGANTVGVKVTSNEMAFIPDMRFNIINAVYAETNLEDDQSEGPKVKPKVIMEMYDHRLNDAQLTSLKDIEKEMVKANSEVIKILTVSGSDALSDSIAKTLKVTSLNELKLIENIMIKENISDAGNAIKKLNEIKKEESEDGVVKRKFFGGW